FKRAITQRSRWVTGIGLQSWEKHDLMDTLSQSYWFWRDRKGLFCNLLTPLTNAVCLYGIVTWAIARALHTPWGLGAEMRIGWLLKLGWWPLLLVLPQTLFRMWTTT